MAPSGSFDELVDRYAVGIGSAAELEAQDVEERKRVRREKFRECDEIVLNAVEELRRRGIKPNSVGCRDAGRPLKKYLPLRISHPRFGVWVLPPIAIAADASAWWLGVGVSYLAPPSSHAHGYSDIYRRRIGSDDMPTAILRGGSMSDEAVTPLTPENLRIALAEAIGKILVGAR